MASSLIAFGPSLLKASLSSHRGVEVKRRASTGSARTALGLFGFMAAAPVLAQPSAAPAPAPDYAQPASWLCLPGRADPCGTPLPTTALNANGYGSVGRSAPNPKASVDCFYVYPTVSRDPGLNSDMVAGPEESGAAMAQFGRFHEVCRPFAPLYRQMTLAALRQAVTGADLSGNLAQAYADVRNAWRHYLQHHNKGRPFVLVGHSQGTLHLNKLLAEEIEGKPEARRMLSALLIGYTVEVPVGKTVGGTFKQTPLCTRRGQTGCVVTYQAFRAEAPPMSAGGRFGRTDKPGMTVGCVNPATLGRGSAKLDSYWFTATTPQPGVEPIAWSSQGKPPTPFVRTDDLIEAACVNRQNIGYLAVRVNADPKDPRTDRIPGDVHFAGRLAPDWGLHVADMNLARAISSASSVSRAAPSGGDRNPE
jgi:hypothetical protein